VTIAILSNEKQSNVRSNEFIELIKLIGRSMVRNFYDQWSIPKLRKEALVLNKYSSLASLP
jgi:hypothetical protein